MTPRLLLITVQFALAMTAITCLPACDDGTQSTPAVPNAGVAANSPPAVPGPSDPPTDSASGSAQTPASTEALSPGPRSRAADNPPGWPPVEFEPAVVDFGVVEPESAQTGTVRIWNVSSQPLRILKAVPSCGCTSTDPLDGRVIPAQGYTDFDVRMELKSGLGEKREGLRMAFQGASEAADLYFKAIASLPVRVDPPHIDATKTVSGTLNVSSLDGRAFSILSTMNEPPRFVGFDPTRDAPRSAYTIEWDVTPMQQRGIIPWFWVIETDHPEAQLVDVRLRHMQTRPVRPPGRQWQPKDMRKVIGTVQNGVPVEVSAKIEYPANRTPQPATAGIVSQSPYFEAQLISTEVDGPFLKYHLRITPLNAPPGLLYGTLTIKASGFDAPLRIIGKVE